MVEQIREASRFIHDRGVTNPLVGVILGTGLGNRFVQEVSNQLTIPYSDIPHFPISTVESHHGKLIFGLVHDTSVLVMQGRFHYYEGYSASQVTFPVRVMKDIGVRHLLISNAAGNLNPQWHRGDLMVIDDHINLQPDNPLRGKNDDSLGVRFPDMSQPYSQDLIDRLQALAKQERITLRHGVYAAVSGPNLETRAEYRFLRTIGADAVGMSTVPEVIVANHAGLSCCAVSVLTDDCDPDNLKPVSLAEIIAVSREAEPKLTKLFVALIGQLR